MARPVFILVGPEDAERLEAIKAGQAPRLDYRLVAERCQGTVLPMYPSSAALRGPKWWRLCRSISANLRTARHLLSDLPAGSVVYSTGETWGLPLGLLSGIRNRHRFTHVMYAHRIYSVLWLRLLRAIQPVLHVDGWICVTRRQAGLLRRALGSNAAPIRVVPQGVDTSFFSPRLANTQGHCTYLLSMGSEMRNYPLLFETVRCLDVTVVVKASSTWMASPRQPLGMVPSNVTILTDYLPYVQLRDLYAGASLVLVPVHDTAQASGISTILEAMAMCKCVVATSSRGLPDCLVDGLTGAVVEPSAQRLAETMDELLQRPKQVSELALHGHALVKTGLSLEAHAMAVSDALLAIASGLDV